MRATRTVEPNSEDLGQELQDCSCNYDAAGSKADSGVSSDECSYEPAAKGSGVGYGHPGCGNGVLPEDIWDECTERPIVDASVEEAEGGAGELESYRPSDFSRLYRCCRACFWRRRRGWRVCLASISDCDVVALQFQRFDSMIGGDLDVAACHGRSPGAAAVISWQWASCRDIIFVACLVLRSLKDARIRLLDTT